MVLQFSPDHRQGGEGRGTLRRSKEIAKRAEAKLWKFRSFAHLEDVMNLLFCNRAAVVAYTEEEGSMIEAWRECSGCGGAEEVGIAVVIFPDPQGENPRSIRALPPEKEGQVHLVLLGTHEDVVAIARMFQDRRQTSGMSE